MSELTKRVLSALVLAPVAIAAIWFGDAALATFLGVAAAAGAWEFCRIARGAGAEPFDGAAIVLAAVGLASNLAALRALAGEGIQRGHMKLHQRRLEAVELQASSSRDGGAR